MSLKTEAEFLAELNAERAAERETADHWRELAEQRQKRVHELAEQANKFKDEAEALRKDSERLAYMLRTRAVVENSPNHNVYWLTFPDGYVTREVFQDPKVALDWAIINMAKPND